ncbi:MAG TPA: aminoacyl-tRNA hydrolase [Gammaproteobacteria bacterium]|nr:aminoacyl-tRNA hydrolase [Gammaproteobacteria bacterium]
MAGTGAGVDAIVGLGNPGGQYALTRHNVGFWVVDLLARQHGAGFRRQRRLHGEHVRIELDGRPVHLLKPETYVNRSGQAVQGLAAYFGLQPDRILVVHDDLDLPPGIVRLKRGGGHGGHNGLRDVIRHLGSDFLRLRIGIGHPGDRGRVIDYVLSPPAAAEEDLILEAVAAGVDALSTLFGQGFERAQQELNSRPSPAAGKRNGT